ncbi:MAG: Rrf2 family transcriptional regulator [Phascolarctobacterium faecium]
MQLNVTTDYAIRIVLYLAIKKRSLHQKKSEPRWGFRKNYVLKITHKLVEAGIIERLVGAQGGFSLAQKIDDITLLDILNINGTDNEG